MKDDNLISTENLTGGYGKSAVIRDVSFDIKKGDFLGIIGPNGSGKSTLLKLMSRVLTPQSGRVTLDKTDIRHMGLKGLSQKIAFVPQETLINFSFSVEEIVLMGRIPHLKRLQHETKNDHAIVQRSLQETDTVNLKDKYINELSAGERQRAIIARALAQEPAILFLDEPTSHLDIGHQIQMLNLLKKLNRERSLTVLIVLHDLNLASEYCDRLILLEKGRIFKVGAPHEVLTYQNIEKVYKTIVVVNENPISKKPYVLLVSGERKTE
ncbi:MAG TPA: heme ABC transporter ATP-binding protein [Candidatus Omnitrophica bacterium]|nr:heme ABC transporter ATP-binding protein [Candidatus Omnitrophota bacterium]